MISRRPERQAGGARKVYDAIVVGTGMAVHGRFREPCPRCEDPVQRIQYASSETNYCATCQTDGQVFADRVLSQLLKKDWPRTLEEREQIGRDS